MTMTRSAAAAASSGNHDRDQVRGERPPGPETLYREMSMRVELDRLGTRGTDGAIPADAPIPIALSSETPVLRYDFWDDEYYWEVLDHSAAAVDLSRATDGIPFLLEHMRYDLHGIIENVRIDSDRVLRGEVRFSQAARSREIRQDMLDGIRKSISVGYLRDRNNLQRSQKEGEKHPTVMVKSWTPTEGSSVSMPADTTVGVGRSADGAAPAQDHHSHPVRGRGAQEQQMRQNGAPPANGETSNTEEQDVTRSAPGAGALPVGSGPAAGLVPGSREAEILDMCEQAGVDMKRSMDFVRSGSTVQQVRAELFKQMRGERPEIDNARDSIEEISPSERREFSVGRALQAHLSGNWKNAGYEREVGEMLQRRLSQVHPVTSGFLAPTWALGQRAAHVAGTPSLGGNILKENYGGWIDQLRPRSVFLSMGVQYLPGLTGILVFHRQASSGTVEWLAENPGVGVTESNMTFETVEMRPRMQIGKQRYSKMLLAQSAGVIDTKVREDMLNNAASKLDISGFHGAGGTETTGLYNLAGVNVVAFGGGITHAKAVAMESAIEADNANVAAMGYVFTPEVKGTGKTTPRMGAGTEATIWTGSAVDGEVNGYRAITSNNLSKTLGAGSEHAGVFGAWGTVMVGDWGAVEITVDTTTEAGKGNILLYSNWLVDIGYEHPQAFSRSTGLTP